MIESVKVFRHAFVDSMVFSLSVLCLPASVIIRVVMGYSGLLSSMVMILSVCLS